MVAKLRVIFLSYKILEHLLSKFKSFWKNRVQLTLMKKQKKNQPQVGKHLKMLQKNQAIRKVRKAQKNLKKLNNSNYWKKQEMPVKWILENYKK